MAQKVARIDRRIFIRKHMEYGRVRLLFKALPKTGLVLQEMKQWVARSQSSISPLHFSLVLLAKKIDDPIVNVHYFAKPKSWMTTENFDTVIFSCLVLMKS